MKTPIPTRKNFWRVGMIFIVCALGISGCVSPPLPLAMLPMVEPQAAELNLKGIDQYQIGEWEAALHFFQAAIQVNTMLVEAHFNAALALHQLKRHQEATAYFKRAGELDPENRSVISSTLYRNHLGLSSTFERHISGGYRYQGEEE